MVRDNNLRITIDEWTADGRTLIKYHARLESELVGFVAFDALVKQDATVHLFLRNGAHVLREHTPISWQEAARLREA